MTLREEIEALRLEIAELRGEVAKLTGSDPGRDSRSTTTVSIGFGSQHPRFADMRRSSDRPVVKA